MTEVAFVPVVFFEMELVEQVQSVMKEMDGKEIMDRALLVSPSKKMAFYFKNCELFILET